jgi:anti-anti-sigma factor
MIGAEIPFLLKGPLDRRAEFCCYARCRGRPMPSPGKEPCMEIQKERVGDTYVVSANGRLDGIYSTAFAKEVADLIIETNPKVLIDFAEIDFVTSAGIRAVLLLIKKAEASGVVFALCGVNKQVRDVLDVAGLAPVITIYPGRSQGLAAMNA